jgi:hypothetical protein
MGPYTKILIVAFILLILSFFTESNNTYELDSYPKLNKYIYIYSLRYYHFLIYLFSSFYLIIFYGTGKEFDRYLYLFIMFSIVIGWYVFDSCCISFIELLFYDINTQDIKTTFNPTFNSLFCNYSDMLMIISGISFVITVPIVLYYSRTIPLIIKAIYYTVFMGLFIDSSVKGRLKTMYYDDSNNKQLAYCKSLYETYFSSSDK